MKLAVIGLTITSSWGNGHATTYRALLKAFARRGHEIDFLECDKPWYAENRDQPEPEGCRVHLFAQPGDLNAGPLREILDAADAILIGSYVPDGVAVIRQVLDQASAPVCFYDIDTPVTLGKLSRGDHEYLSPDLIPEFATYLSFAGGRALEILETKLRSRRTWPLFCSVDPDHYHPAPEVRRDLDLGYLGTWSEDRQPTVERFLIEPARQLPMRRFSVAGSQYPDSITWPQNVTRTEHLPPDQHPHFYQRQRLTLNVTRQDMIALGHSPSVRLFEASACGTPIVSDRWLGLDDLFEIGREILVVDSTEEIVDLLQRTDDQELRDLGERARRRVHKAHTSERRAAQLEAYLEAVGA